MSKQLKVRRESEVKRARAQNNVLGEQFINPRARYQHYPLPIYFAQSVLPTTRGPVMVRGSLESDTTYAVHILPKLVAALSESGLEKDQCVHVTQYAWTHIALHNEHIPTLKFFIWDWKIIIK